MSSLGKEKREVLDAAEATLSDPLISAFVLRSGPLLSPAASITGMLFSSLAERSCVLTRDGFLHGAFDIFANPILSLSLSLLLLLSLTLTLLHTLYSTHTHD